MVYIKHKSAAEGSAPATTSEEAFEQVWKDKGWKLCDADGKPTSSVDKASVEGQE